MNFSTFSFSIIVLAISILLSISSSVVATQDMEDPDDIIATMRVVLLEPEIYQEIKKLSDAGCVWDNQVFWSGSPSEENLRTKIFWLNFSAQFRTKSGKTFWTSFAFSSKGGEILEIINNTKESEILECSM
jgi:hypothetical protein